MAHNAIPLSELGNRQAAVLAEHLELVPCQVLVSPMLRTQQTAAPYCARFSVEPAIMPALAEFSVIDETLIEGLDGAQRKPLVKPYWDHPDPHRRLGPKADTFMEFDARVGQVQAMLADLSGGSVIFGHGIWFALLAWRLQGCVVASADDMAAFRRFQVQLPMPNCAVFKLSTADNRRWFVQADQEMAHRIAAVGI
jgi:alpha-ribazole phosphatase